MSARIVIDAIGLCCVRGIGDERLLDPAVPTRFAAPPLAQFANRKVGMVPAFDSERFVGHRKSLKYMSRASLLGVVAARTAVAQANDGATNRVTESFAKNATTAALYFCVGENGGEVAPYVHRLEASKTPEGTIDFAALGREVANHNPLSSFQMLNNMALCHISIELGIGGPNGVMFAGCGDGLQAFENGAWAIRARNAPWALVGGCEAPVNTTALAVIPENPSAPIAEGAAALLLRPQESTRPDQVEWIGLSDHRHQSVERAWRSLSVTAPMHWVLVGPDARRDLPPESHAVHVNSVVGKTWAAGSALSVALAVQQLRKERAIREVVILAQDEEGTSVALLRRGAT